MLAGDACQLVRRLLPGSEELSSPTWRSSRENWLRVYPEFALPEDQKKAWLADRTGRHRRRRHGEAVRLEGRRSRSAAGHDLSAAGRGRVGVQHRRHLRLAVKGTDKTQLFFHYRFLNEAIPQRGFANQVGWYVIKVADPSAVARRSRRRSTPCSRTLRRRRRRTPRRRSSHGFGQAGRQHQPIMTRLIATAAILMILLVDGQHDGAVDPRAHQRAGGAQDAWVRRRPHPRMVLLESMPDRGRRRRGWASRVCWTIVICARRSDGGFLPTFFFPVRDVVVGVGAGPAARHRGGHAAGTCRRAACVSSTR